ncbi:uncharacterized protein PV06_11706 [Exophiala oligosperma]|uniref:C2H2-type domain-containing protein n=1 Tax=Exophiala oligosperma TaxID=215243 RepID=A0A0D2A6N9_9EURO|nr:uncharacterized protein PV06_11706 [Exophiala oligosperma]KIW35986.1 hypothetical protein PV06_11706 [Exophiala oligosperma]
MVPGIQGENSLFPHLSPEERYAQAMHMEMQPWTPWTPNLRSDVNLMNLDILRCFASNQQQSMVAPGLTPYILPWQTNIYEEYLVLQSNVSNISFTADVTATLAKKHVCRYLNCLSRRTGKQSSFNRADHLKRHETTVHKTPGSPVYRCWVSGCKRPFTRKDNLRAHLKTHLGKPGSRNRYVASLDPQSSVYNLQWEGELDYSGFPVLGSTSRGAEIRVGWQNLDVTSGLGESGLPAG